ncbi:hypothetical protein A9Q88_13800 [Gammaproteobacteria bacterium 50_400_T64]|nr:hypothetical protein A9Q88_13800 [Gammaproteobacteria bacterium 50_400_T64]
MAVQVQGKQVVASVDISTSAEDTSPAWLLDISGGLTVAVAAQDVIYVFPQVPQVVPVPQTPDHVTGVLVWQQRLVPAIDLGMYLDLKQTANDEIQAEVMVLVALAGSKLGALVLRQIPERVDVADSRQCDLPPVLHGWDCLAPSCFMHEVRGVVPILDLNTVFGRNLKTEIKD